MKRVFILGAGASVFAGYPLGLDLWQWAIDHCSGEVMASLRVEETVRELNPILHRFARAVRRFDLEEVFTFLDLAALGRGPLAGEVTNWPTLRNHVMGMIAESFQSYQHSFGVEVFEDRPTFALGIDRLRMLDVLARWTDWLQPSDTIISFNWDLLHESALWRAGKWHVADGYGFDCFDLPTGPGSPILMLKLHGSANWAQRDERDTEPGVVHKATFFPGVLDDHRVFEQGRADWSDGHRLIVPTYLKDVSRNPLLLGIWRQAAAALEHTTELIVIGSQLNPADAPARLLFALALGANAGLGEIIVVGPRGGPDHWDEFAVGIGKEVRFIDMTFEHWLLAGAPR
ncbi:MAG: hypothetical protein ACRERC_17015 [Candidatus Binatia bacterium]